MKYTQLKNDITEGARSVYLLDGNDAYFRMNAEAQLKSAFLQMPELNFTSFDCTQYRGAAYTDITSAMQSFPFMAEKRIIKLIDFYPSEADYEKYFKTAFENCPSSTLVIIVNSTAQKGADLKRKKCITYVDCNHADEETVTKWAYITLKRAGVVASADACQAIAAYCLCDMARVSKEVQKIIELNKEGEITRADVDELVYKDADYRIYEMTNAVSRKNYSRFTEICYDLLSKGADENVIISSLLSYFKNLLIILSSSQTNASLAQSLKMKEYGVKMSGEQARAIGKDKLIYYVNSLYCLSSRIKSGQLTAGGALSCALSDIFFA